MRPFVTCWSGRRTDVEGFISMVDFFRRGAFFPSCWRRKAKLVIEIEKSNENQQPGPTCALEKAQHVPLGSYWDFESPTSSILRIYILSTYIFRIVIYRAQHISSSHFPSPVISQDIPHVTDLLCFDAPPSTALSRRITFHRSHH